MVLSVIEFGMFGLSIFVNVGNHLYLCSEKRFEKSSENLQKTMYLKGSTALSSNDVKKFK